MRQTHSVLTMRTRHRAGVVVALGILSVILSSCASGGGPPQPSSGTSVVLGGEVVFEAASGDQPIQGARVEIVFEERILGNTLTDADGRFRISDLPTAPFNLLVTTGEDYQDYDHKREIGVPLDPGAFPNGRKFLSIRVEGHLTVLTGSVTTADGLPVAGVSVRTYPATVNATTQDDGTFEIRSGRFEKSVDYRIEVSQTGFLSKLSHSLRPTIGQTKDVGTITLVAYELDKRGTGGGEWEVGGTGPGEVTQGD